MTATPKFPPVTGHGAARITDSNIAANFGEVRRTSDIKNVSLWLEGDCLEQFRAFSSGGKVRESIEAGGS